MLKKIIFTAPLISILFTACSSYSAVHNFNNSEIYANALHYTKKADVLEENRVKIMFTATYLNEVYKENQNKNKRFLISIFEVNQKNFINKTQIHAKLNNKEFQSIKKLSSNDELRDNLVLKNPWAKYFIVSFAKDDETKYSKTQELKLSYKDSKEVSLSFK